VESQIPISAPQELYYEQNNIEYDTARIDDDGDRAASPNQCRKHPGALERTQQPQWIIHSDRQYRPGGYRSNHSSGLVKLASVFGWRDQKIHGWLCLLLHSGISSRDLAYQRGLLDQVVGSLQRLGAHRQDLCHSLYGRLQRGGLSNPEPLHQPRGLSRGQQRLSL